MLFEVVLVHGIMQVSANAANTNNYATYKINARGGAWLRMMAALFFLLVTRIVILKCEWLHENGRLQNIGD